MQKLTEIMSRDVQVVPPTCTLQDAAAQMRALDVGAIPVCDGKKLVGMITDRDIAIRAAADGKDPTTCKVSDVMSDSVAWCFDDDDLDDVVRTMRERQIRRIPVVNHDKQLVGIVALSDVATSSASDGLKSDGVEAVSRQGR